MTDAFVLLQLPNAGDDLQAIKKGVMELADVVAINKADIDPAAATRAEAQIVSSLRLLGIHHAHGKEAATAAWLPRVLQLSALQGTGVATFWDCLQQFQRTQQANSEWTVRRQKQALSWMWERIQSGLQQAFKSNPAVAAQLPLLSSEVANGGLAASTAARQLLALASAPS
jgi:LAO/AO transport system kinase